ncbi:sugar ABC transporter permease [Streptomyces sp. ISL-100]|uniref:carbohydrate ABC transporter permease n=1 Tax=Streptomyces sp. ISL-100 TaxID=2819173 RepID=UPI0027E4E5C2|nr:sugar ABC transporter permease [Streptomyces sp. ISL-100]
MPRRGRNRNRAGGRREALTGYLFVAPAVLLFAVLGLYTIGYGLALSVHEWNGITPTWTWAGLDNFRDLLWAVPSLADSTKNALGRTLAVMVGAAVPTVLISLALALALNSVGRIRGFLQTLYFLPYVTTGIAVFYAWRFILLPDGALNSVLETVGLDFLVEPEGFLGNPETALWTTTGVLVWGMVPLGVLLYLSALQSIDDAVLEAARLDGASAWKIATRIVWPMLRPTTALLVVLVLRGVLQEFQIFLLMTNGGPLDRTTTLPLLAYNYAFGRDAVYYGYASALGWLLFLFSVALAALTFVVLRRRT